ncbi:MAG: CsbD family protein [Bradyrhizobium sp.]|uniref:CsbD family protein n=1 Tax=Bradyrhizobium sp. TaxID=376 RepID=UPI001D92C9B9|nr:CsbD family protein [Bradyrhizobium sp.]MBV9560990.1 CsbD family protein [Bradyrhizobium sp.]
MNAAKGITKKLAGKAKQVVVEVFGDQRLQDEGAKQEQERRAQSEQSGEHRLLGNLDRLT